MFKLFWYLIYWFWPVLHRYLYWVSDHIYQKCVFPLQHTQSGENKNPVTHCICVQRMTLDKPQKEISCRWHLILVYKLIYILCAAKEELKMVWSEDKRTATGHVLSLACSLLISLHFALVIQDFPSPPLAFSPQLLNIYSRVQWGRPFNTWWPFLKAIAGFDTKELDGVWRQRESTVYLNSTSRILRALVSVTEWHFTGRNALMYILYSFERGGGGGAVWLRLALFLCQCGLLVAKPLRCFKSILLMCEKLLCL